MKPATANQQPEPVDRERIWRKYLMYGILEERGEELTFLGQFKCIPPTWTLGQYQQALGDLEREGVLAVDLKDREVGLRWNFPSSEDYIPRHFIDESGQSDDRRN